MFEAYEEFRKMSVGILGQDISREEFQDILDSNPEYGRAVGDEIAFMRVAPGMLAAVNRAQLPFKYSSSAVRGAWYVPNKSKHPHVLQKLLPAIAYSVSEDEHANWTYEELCCYIDTGVTIGKHTPREQAIIDGVVNAYRLLPMLAAPTISVQDVCKIHSIVMKNVMQDVTQLGCLRTRDVKLQGVEYWQSVPAYKLRETFEREAEAVNAIKDVVTRAIVCMLWLSHRQFFYDGNKRVAHTVCNAILGSAGVGVFCIPKEHIHVYQGLLYAFYETADATAIIKFTLDHCLTYFPDDKTTHWP